MPIDNNLNMTPEACSLKALVPIGSHFKVSFVKQLQPCLQLYLLEPKILRMKILNEENFDWVLGVTDLYYESKLKYEYQ